VEEFGNFFLEFEQDGKLLILGFELGYPSGIALPGGFFVALLLA
jgi:hypothetical protein